MSICIVPFRITLVYEIIFPKKLRSFVVFLSSPTYTRKEPNTWYLFSLPYRGSIPENGEPWNLNTLGFRLGDHTPLSSLLWRSVNHRIPRVCSKLFRSFLADPPRSACLEWILRWILNPWWRVKMVRPLRCWSGTGWTPQQGRHWTSLNATHFQGIILDANVWQFW